MSSYGCESRFGCTGIAIVASLIVGIITAFLRITAVITVTPAFLWVLFGIAVVYLADLLLAVSLKKHTASYECTCSPLSVLLAGILGTILLSVILLAIEFVATSVIGAVITGALLFFFSLTVSATACLVKCFANCNG